eukprot:IDg18432t1
MIGDLPRYRWCRIGLHPLRWMPAENDRLIGLIFWEALCPLKSASLIDFACAIAGMYTRHSLRLSEFWYLAEIGFNVRVPSLDWYIAPDSGCCAPILGALRLRCSPVSKVQMAPVEYLLKSRIVSFPRTWSYLLDAMPVRCEVSLCELLVVSQRLKELGTVLHEFQIRFCCEGVDEVYGVCFAVQGWRELSR